MADATKTGRVAIAGSGTASKVGQAGGRNSFPRGCMDRPPGLARAKTWLRNIPGSKRVIKKVLRFDGRALSSETGTNASATAARANEKAEQDSRRTRSLYQGRNGGHLRLGLPM